MLVPRTANELTLGSSVGTSARPVSGAWREVGRSRAKAPLPGRARARVRPAMDAILRFMGKAPSEKAARDSSPGEQRIRIARRVRQSSRAPNSVVFIATLARGHERR